MGVNGLDNTLDMNKKSFINSILAQLEERNGSSPTKTLFFDVSCFVDSKAKTGIQRVVLEWLKYLPKMISEDYIFVPVVCKKGSGYYLYNEKTAKRVVSPRIGDVFLGIDLCAEQILEARQELLEWQRKGCKLVACLYDLVFVLYPQVVFASVYCGILTDWLNFICSSFDGIVCISETVMKDALYYAKTKGINNPKCYYSYYHLGCDFTDITTPGVLSGDVRRIKETNKMSFLAVSTLEPRKGYFELIKAFENAVSAGLDSNLIIVGRLGWDAESIEDRIKNSCLYEKQLFWFSDCDDEKLNQLYSISDFYVSASFYEGFGLGVVEGAMHGLPALVRDIPVYREICKKQAVYFHNAEELCTQFHYCFRHKDELKKDIISPLTWAKSIEMGWNAVKDCLRDDDWKYKHKQIIPGRIHLLLSTLAFADGIGRDVFFQKSIFEEKGFTCDIYTVNFDEDAINYRYDIHSLHSAPDDLIIDHISGQVNYDDIIARQPCRKVFLYHNITPPNYVTNEVKAFCEAGLKQVPELSNLYDFIAGDSKYNLDCLRDLGVNRDGDVLPIPVEFSYERVKKKFDPAKTVEFLFVGRVVNNKRFEDIIDAFAYYHKILNRNSKLTLAGKIDVAGDYYNFIKKKITSSGCANSIRMTGRVSDEQLHQLYLNSDVFLCMSEHEGFCIPLLEAMYNGLVVFAFETTAIGETMGNAGVLFHDRTPEIVANLIDSTLKDTNQVEKIIETEAKHVENYSRDRVKARLVELYEKWTDAEYIRPEYIKEANKFFLRNNLKKKIESSNVFTQFTVYSIPLSKDKGFKGSIKRFIQKVVRKFTRWMLNPLCAEQNRINNYLITLINEILEM